MVEKSYKFFYKTTNKTNGKYYYGVHQTDNLDDGYLGSGRALIKAVQKYGRDNFHRKILKFFDDEDDMYEWEEQIVNDNVVSSRETYNLQPGGRWYAGSSQEFWNSKGGDQLKAEMSELNSGFNNAAFKKHWEAIYDTLSDEFQKLVLTTSLHDSKIIDSLEYSVKFDRLLKYCIERKGMPKVEKVIRYNDYAGGAKLSTVRKTICHTFKPEKTFKFFHEDVFLIYPEIYDIIFDNNISDSMLYNGLIGSSAAIFFSYVPYLKYLNILIDAGTIDVDIRNTRPNSQRRWGKKTIYKLNENFTQDYTLIGQNINEQYKIIINGRDVSYIRV